MNTPISQITLSEDGTQATGVVLENGEKLTADVVVVNADLVSLLPSFDKHAAHK